MAITISTHVLDTTLGRPAAGIPVTLERRADTSGMWQTLANAETDTDGRIASFRPPDELMQPGRYRLIFETEAYFAAWLHPVFFPVVQIEFVVPDDGSLPRYHVPLLLSPHGYSTYRGS